MTLFHLPLGQPAPISPHIEKYKEEKQTHTIQGHVPISWENRKQKHFKKSNPQVWKPESVSRACFLNFARVGHTS